jgi:DNA polymerase-3 subunit gamma/tau
LLAKIADVAELTPDFADILQQMLRVLHRVALLQQMPDFVDQEFDKQLLETLAKTLLPEDVQLYYQIGLIGQRDLPLAPDPRSGFEMVMLRMLTFRPQSTQQLVEPVKPAIVKATANVSTQPTQLVVAEAKSIEEPRPVSASPTARPGSWTDIIGALNISGRTRELANNCVLDGIDDSSCRLLLDPSFQQVGTKAEDNLRAALQNYYGKSLKLVITQQAVQQMTPALEIQKAREDRQQAAVDSINADENVQALKETFGARIMPGSIEPLN